MSTTTLKLPYKRFVAQVSTGVPRSKSTYIALMEENLEALKKCPWREANDQPVALANHDFTASTHFSDALDAFKMTGNYNSQTNTEVAYAGMVAYRFKIPASAISGSVSVASVSLPVSRDRFLKSGLHVAAALSESATPTSDWATVRGSGDLAASSVLVQTAANLMSGSAGADAVAIDLSGVSSGNPAAYLWIYVTLEDYTDHWEMYNAREKRLYAIEGSAMLTGGGVSVAFDGEVTADQDSGAGTGYLFAPISVRVTHYEAYHRTLRPKVCFTALSVASGYAPLTSGSTNSLPVKSILLPVATWQFPADTRELPATYSLATNDLRIPEGDYIIEAWIDESGDGKFTPGEPYGCTQVVSLSASVQTGLLEIELTEVHPSVPRMDISKMIAGMPPASARPDGDNPDPYPVSDSTFATLAAATDRGRWELPWATIEPAQYPGVDAPLAASLLTRVRIVRDKINEDDHNGDTLYVATLFDHYFDLSRRPILTEADIFADGLLTLDWDAIVQAYGGNVATLTDVTYRIVIGNNETGEHELDGNNLPILFVNHFEYKLLQSQVTPDPNISGASYSGQPTFRWSHTNEIDKAYPAFQCMITTSNEGSLISGSTIVYKSGPLRAPLRDKAGMYEWTAPVKAGDTVELDGGGTFTFMTNTTYYWVVSMCDDKFVTVNNRTEALTPFSFAATAN